MVFYNWAEGAFIRKIDVPPQIFWNETGDAVHPRARTRRYVLKLRPRRLSPAALDAGGVPDDGIEGAFEPLHEISDKVTTGQWIGDCFLFTNAGNRLNYFVGGETITLCHLDHEMYMLGYLAKENRAFLIDKTLNVVS